MPIEYDNVRKDFLSGKIKGCKAYFENHGYYVEAGYCYLILDNFVKAEEMFMKEKDFNTRASWGLILIQMLSGNIKSSPTYFQIRNFLEIDISILILYCKEKYVENLIRYADFLAYYNPESYKFIGRAFWANDLMSAAKFFLQRAKDKFYQDPELHYLLGYIQYHVDNKTEIAKKSLNTCLEILPAYAPAVNLLKKLV